MPRLEENTLINFAVLVNIGPYEFAKGFQTEREAIACFDAIAANQDGEAESGTLTMPANALVDRVTLRRYNDNIDRVTDSAAPTEKGGGVYGDPSRQ